MTQVSLGVYFGLKSQQPKVLSLPSENLTANITGMREQGAFLTSSSDYDPKIFSWSPDNLGLESSKTSLEGVDIAINTSNVQQAMDGFGAGFTDSSCWLLAQLKQSNLTEYDRIMDYFFNNRTGMSTIRVPIAATDYSAQGVYTFAEYNATSNSSSASTSPLASFNITRAQPYILPVLRDARTRRPDLKIMMSAWSPPAWMKTSNSTNGGQLLWGQEPLLAEYLARTVDAFAKAGVRPDSLTIQNEPTKGFISYPSNWMSAAQQGLVAGSLREQMRTLGYSSVKIFAHDDNWSQWQVAVDTLKANSSAFDGLAWHCYEGNATEIDNTLAALNATTTSLEAHLTECTTTDDRDNQWYSTQYWLQRNLFASINRGVRSVITWNVVLDKKNKPYIDGAPCQDCLGTFTLTSPDNSIKPFVWTGNAQYIVTYHFAAATANLTRLGGGAAYRVDAVMGTQNPSLGSKLSCLSGMSAFAAPWNGTALSSSAEKRVGLVVQNDCGSKVTATIGVDGRRGHYKFDGGLTTLIFNA